ncbi:hypothetical protein BKI52_11815 [marine bacterium AO1-C]|nr:hypothetical protein BKI52_11815 [marine bacterium AO1-C]
MFGFFKRKKKSSDEVEVDKTLKKMLKPDVFPNGMQDVEAGADMVIYILNQAVGRDLAKVVFVSSLRKIHSDHFNEQQLKAHLPAYCVEFFNDLQFKNFYRYMQTIFTVKELFKQAPMDVRRVEDVDAAQQELHFATDTYQTKYVVSEGEMFGQDLGVPQEENNEQGTDEELKKLLPPELFPNNLADVETGTEMFLYIIKNMVERDFAKAIFVHSTILANKAIFNLESFKLHLTFFKDLVLNEMQITNLYNYFHTIITVKKLFKEAPVDIKRVEDVDPANQELHYKTNNYNTKYVVSEDEMPEWAFDASQLLTGLVMKGIADNPQAGHYDEIPEGTGRFGWDVTNPIPVNGIPANEMYLRKLETDDGRMITWQRRGSHSSPNIGGMIDKYEIFSGKKKSIGFLYISPYHKKLSQKVPEGFRFR